MTFVSFPIAHPPPFRNPPRSVFLITFLLPQDDTSDVIPRHTMLRHTHYSSATRNFRLTPSTPPTQLRDLSPLHPRPTYASPLLCAPHHAWRDARPGGARKQGGQAQVDSLSHPTDPYSLVSRETSQERRFVFDMRLGWLAPLAVVVLLRRTPAPPALIAGEREREREQRMSSSRR